MLVFDNSALAVTADGRFLCFTDITHRAGADGIQVTVLPSKLCQLSLRSWHSPPFSDSLPFCLPSYSQFDSQENMRKVNRKIICFLLCLSSYSQTNCALYCFFL